MLRRINRKAGLDWHCLDFRHTFGSHLAMKGESLYKISELMGNSPEICRRHYAAQGRLCDFLRHFCGDFLLPAAVRAWLDLRQVMSLPACVVGCRRRKTIRAGL